MSTRKIATVLAFGPSAAWQLGSTMAARIGWAIDQSGYTTPALGERIGCTHAALSQWRNGHTTTIRSDLLLKFADTTGIELRWLIEGAGPVRSRHAIGADLCQIEDALLHVARESRPTYEAIKRMILAAAEMN